MTERAHDTSAARPRLGHLRGAAFHLVGVGGCGMAPLAQLLSAQGARVTGSDRGFDRGNAADVRGQLEQAGVRIVPQDGSGVGDGLNAVVVSAAIEDRIPDLARARRAGIPVFLRGMLLAEICRDARTLAVAGTSGKSTVVAMTGWILRQAGLDPTIYNGAPMLNFAGPGRRGDFVAGRGNWFCTETDESDGTAAGVRAAIGVITNLSRDHKELDELEAIFRAFASGVREHLVLGDDPALTALAKDAPARQWRVGAGPDAGMRYRIASAPGDRVRMEMLDVLVELPLVGDHNAANAAMAMAAAVAAGVDPADAGAALAEFRGVARRLQFLGERADGVAVIDDFAHNPAKVAAGIAAVKPNASRVTLVFQPHGFAPARRMKDELAAVLAGTFSGGDRVLLLPIYDAGGTTSRDISSADVAAAIEARGVAATVVADRDVLLRDLAGSAIPRETIIVAGARDPSLSDLAQRVAAALGIERGKGWI